MSDTRTPFTAYEEIRNAIYSAIGSSKDGKTTEELLEITGIPVKVLRSVIAEAVDNKALVGETRWRNP